MELHVKLDDMTIAKMLLIQKMARLKSKNSIITHTVDVDYIIQEALEQDKKAKIIIRYSNGIEQEIKGLR